MIDYASLNNQAVISNILSGQTSMHWENEMLDEYQQRYLEYKYKTFKLKQPINTT